MLRGSLPPLPSKDVCRSPRSPSRRSKGKGAGGGEPGEGYECVGAWRYEAERRPHWHRHMH
ncbi:hypothetical protein CHLRE_02g143858v5 [Chlamydomonas reinhardtii]|uniref:Uncharacterized protein n=1 Tax=Chlamydomonas reinhardtii TaxID=3055 RepID=A0A2K3E3X3_CHLRE|nr:uncharacterized protein CHLRE_02g143858v5 [Chlamydomonas reinhardtii]PNW87495.1 hypothetical protein CHLRE_02g143858v5 [Chlamydomonas reinhardtii]